MFKSGCKLKNSCIGYSFVLNGVCRFYKIQYTIYRLSRLNWFFIERYARKKGAEIIFLQSVAVSKLWLNAYAISISLSTN